MDILVKKISTKEEESLLINVVKFLKEYYQKELGDSMDFKLALLSEEKVGKFLVRNVSDDPHCYFCLLLFGDKSYGFWLVDESFEENSLEISISSQFHRLEIMEKDISVFEHWIQKAV
ncbi:MAG: hypothetical protein O9264_16180 [Leptospira sp.]|nr:hypothetical protein [Leptospira sp.]